MWLNTKVLIPCPCCCSLEKAVFHLCLNQRDEILIKSVRVEQEGWFTQQNIYEAKIATATIKGDPDRMSAGPFPASVCWRDKVKKQNEWKANNLCVFIFPIVTIPVRSVVLSCIEMCPPAPSASSTRLLLFASLFRKSVLKKACFSKNDSWWGHKGLIPLLWHLFLPYVLCMICPQTCGGSSIQKAECANQ